MADAAILRTPKAILCVAGYAAVRNISSVNVPKEKEKAILLSMDLFLAKILYHYLPLGLRSILALLFSAPVEVYLLKLGPIYLQAVP